MHLQMQSKPADGVPSDEMTASVKTAELPAPIETFEDLMKNRITGDMPDEDLFCSPRWLIFSSPNSYKKPCYGDFTITNRNPHSVVFCIKSKENMMRASQSHGVLYPGEHADITLYLISSDDWPRDVIEYTWKQHKIVCECLKIPGYIRPKNSVEAARIAREIFHYSTMCNPLQRMYTKISIVLE